VEKNFGNNNGWYKCFLPGFHFDIMLGANWQFDSWKDYLRAFQQSQKEAVIAAV